MNNNDLQKNWLNLDSMVCVLTGAAGGIGAAIAAALVRQNAHVVLLDRDEQKCRELAAELAQSSAADVSVLHCDIADPLSVQRAADQVKALHGRCDVLINNASVLQAGALEDLTLEKWNQVLSVNLTGYLLCAQAFGRQMLAQQSGSIVHIARLPRTTRKPSAAPTAQPRPGSLCSPGRSPQSGAHGAFAAMPSVQADPNAVVGGLLCRPQGRAAAQGDDGQPADRRAGGHSRRCAVPCQLAGWLCQRCRADRRWWPGKHVDGVDSAPRF